MIKKLKILNLKFKITSGADLDNTTVLGDGINMLILMKQQLLQLILMTVMEMLERTLMIHLILILMDILQK